MHTIRKRVRLSAFPFTARCKSPDVRDHHDHKMQNRTGATADFTTSTIAQKSSKGGPVSLAVSLLVALVERCERQRSAMVNVWGCLSTDNLESSGCEARELGQGIRHRDLL